VSPAPPLHSLSAVRVRAAYQCELWNCAGMQVDCFVVLTDSETWSGGIHPTEALRQYRAETGIDARLLVRCCTHVPPQNVYATPAPLAA